MKTLLSLSLLAVLSGAALATEFKTVAFETGNGAGSPNLGQTFSTLGDTYTASFSNFVLTSEPFLDVQWTHSFDTSVATPNSPATSPYTSLTQTVRGSVSRASGTGPISFSAILSETITTATGAYNGGATDEYLFSNNVANAGDSVPFEFTLTVPFNQPLSQGFAIKDDLFFNAGAGTVVRVDSISQGYTPVPEPATFAALAVGGAALLRRRRKN